MPPGPNSFNFMHFWEKIGKIICWCLPEGWRPHIREILDPPLLASNQIMDPLLFTEKKYLKRGFSLKKFDPIVCCRLHCVKTWPKAHSATVSIYFTITIKFFSPLNIPSSTNISILIFLLFIFHGICHSILKTNTEGVLKCEP